jgi:short-chain fatty acids transporter
VIPKANSEDRTHRSLLSRLTGVFVYVLERLMPDPFVFAVLLTLLTAILAFALVPTATPGVIAASWYAGIFNILTFGFQMVLILVTGYALASSKPVHFLLEKTAMLANSPRNAVSLTVAVGMIASWLHWGLGLVVAGLLAREIAKRVRMDFGWLVAAAYTGFVVSTEGLSGSIVLSQATPGSALNLVEKTAGFTLPLSKTVFSPVNLVPVIALFVLLPVIYRWIGPDESHTLAADPVRLKAEDQGRLEQEKRDTFGAALDRAWILNLLLGGGAFCALIFQWRQKGFFMDLNSVILLALGIGLLFHWTPIAYVGAVKNAARVTGPLILQYPIYGGIMGIMTTTGLAAVISKAFLAFTTAHTLPFWTYLSSLLITLFIPSGGGHWAVQGPFVLPAARDLHASFSGTTMGVVMGESVANMLQPFFALPILAIAGIPMRRMMGFMVITFLVSFLVFGAALLLLVQLP